MIITLKNLRGGITFAICSPTSAGVQSELMSVTKLNLRDAPKPKATNFGDQNSVEEFLKDKKFRKISYKSSIR